MINNKHVGSTLDDWLKEEGIYEEVTAAALKRVIAYQVEEAMKEQKITKTEVARRMNTSRVALNRLLDPNNTSVTLKSLEKAAVAVGKVIHLELRDIK